MENCLNILVRDTSVHVPNIKQVPPQVTEPILTHVLGIKVCIQSGRDGQIAGGVSNLLYLEEIIRGTRRVVRMGPTKRTSVPEMANKVTRCVRMKLRQTGS